MAEKVLVLGAKGRFGRAAVKAFAEADWTVRACARRWQNGEKPAYVETVTVDACDQDALIQAATGCDVIINALNPPYPRWKEDLPVLTRNAIAAAKSAGATVMIPGNVYNYGADMPALLNEGTPHRPTTRKGKLRVEMEDAYQRAAADGVRTIILRAGDFIEAARTENWFDSQIVAKVDRGKILYPGPLDQVHAWAYLPDMARAMAMLASRRREFDPFEEFGFPGFSLTGAELIAEVERTTGKTLKHIGLPWPLVRLIGLFNPMMHEVAEMDYLWKVPHEIDGRKLRQAIPEFEPTPVSEAFCKVLSKLFPNLPIPLPQGSSIPSAA